MRTPHTHTHTHTRARARAHARTHAHNVDPQNIEFFITDTLLTSLVIYLYISFNKK